MTANPDELFDQIDTQGKPDDIPPVAAPLPCRACLNTGTEYQRGIGFISPCRGCGKG